MNVQESIQLLMIGGGYMLTQIGSRATTGDIDMVWLLPEIDAGSEIYRLFKAAIQFVASDEGLDAAWLNIDTGDFIHIAGSLPKMKLWKKFEVLHVYVPPKDFILAHKFAANRRKDQNDIKTLCKQLRVNTREKAQKIVNKYIKHEFQEIEHVAEKLNKYFRVGEE
jgi:hypothetical protein